MDLPDDMWGEIVEKCLVSDILNLSLVCNSINQVCKPIINKKRKNIKIFWDKEYFIFSDSNNEFYYLTKTYKVKKLNLSVLTGNVQDIKITFHQNNKFVMYILDNSKKLSSINGKVNNFKILTFDENSYLYNVKPYLDINSIVSIDDDLYIGTKNFIYINDRAVIVNFNIIYLYSFCTILTDEGWKIFDSDFGGGFYFYDMDFNLKYQINNGDIGGEIKNQSSYIYLENNKIINCKNIILDFNEKYLQIYHFQNLLLLFKKDYQIVGHMKDVKTGLIKNYNKYNIRL
jgi:hypothetical protein